VAIARALVSKPAVLVFDEATSAMDAASETAVLQRLSQEIGPRTFVTITHKASLLQMVRKIIVLEQGKVAAQGTPEQFMRQQPGQAGTAPAGLSGQAAAQPTA
jgi:ATP-binding cassette subfamily C protein LapB